MTPEALFGLLGSMMANSGVVLWHESSRIVKLT